MNRLEEKIKFCKVCKNRDFDPMSGVVCGLTKEKPDFECECEKYVADDAQVSMQASRERAKDEENGISGWLTVFLWLGLCGGAIMSIGTSIFNGSFTQGWFMAVLQALYLVPLVATAFMTIYAFYERKPNAVALAKTYIAMIYMDVALTLVVMIALEDVSLLSQVIKNLIWASTWLTYLCCSESVKALIPENSRIWSATEKILLALYAVVWLALGSLSLVGKWAENNPALLSLIVSANQIDNCISESNKELPIDYGNGLVWSKMFKEEDSVVYLYNYKELNKSDLDENYIKNEALVEKHEMMADYAKSVEDPFIGMCRDAGYKVVFRYNDCADQKLYEVVIDLEDYQTIQSSKQYRCPVGDIAMLIDQCKANLPAEYIGGLTLYDLHLSSDNNTLVCSVRLPQMSVDMYKTVTPDYLDDYFHENMSVILDDFIMRLAVINQMTICLDVSTASGLKYAKVHITPDKYNKK